MIEIARGIFISGDDVSFRYSRSAGPGGQNVNKVNTRATLLFDVLKCRSFTDLQKKRILSHLVKRTDKNGCIRVVSRKYRTQKANRRTALERLGTLLQQALKTKPVRKKTKVPQSAHQKRLDEKKHRGRIKKQRAAVTDFNH